MRGKRINWYAGILMLAGTLAWPLALGAEASGMEGRAKAWEKAYNADDINAVTALYAADGCRMPPNAKTAQGSDGILAQLKASKEHGAAKVKLAVTTSGTSGNLAYGVGTYEVLSADGKQVDQGKWIGVAKKLKGAWKIQCDIWNSNLPAPMPQTK